MKLKKLITDKGWLEALSEEFDKPYMLQLEAFLNKQYREGKAIYPKTTEIFNALNLTPLDKVKIVILGQDPYHGPGQAHGLSFSVRPGIRVPPSLENIYKELNSDLSVKMTNHGFLKEWSEQGIFLLNSSLTVEHSKAGSHQNQGWETLTDKMISIINQKKDPVIFMLWGSFARKKSSFINRSKHFILEAPHPSPLSAYRGFLGCRHFSRANSFLEENNLEKINWQLSNIS